MENSCTGIEKTRDADTNKYCNLCFMESETAPNNKQQLLQWNSAGLMIKAAFS